MKSCLLFTIIFFAVSLYATDKLVLLGEKKTVDLLTSKLSANKQLELLDRTQIKKLLREHDLSSHGLTSDKIVKYFPHADLVAIIGQAGDKNNTYPTRITVFNAKNGYKLGNTVLPEKLEAAVEKAIGIIDKAQKKTAGRTLLLSFGVNNMVYLDAGEKFIFTTRSKGIIYIVKFKEEGAKETGKQ
jgi:hypothetical protein